MSIQHFLAGKSFTMRAERHVPLIKVVDELLRFYSGVWSIHRRLVRRGIAARFRGILRGFAGTADILRTGYLNLKCLRAAGDPPPPHLNLLPNHIPCVDSLPAAIQPPRLIRLSVTPV